MHPWKEPVKSLVLCDNTQVDEAAPLCISRECGIEVQAFYDPELTTRDPAAVAAHRQAIAPIELRALHGPFGDLCPGSFDPLVREVARNRLELAYQLAIQLECAHVILHHGYVPGTSSPSGWLRRSVDFWQEYLGAKSSAICFHLENMLELDPDLIADVVRAVGEPNLDICLDVGHAHCNSARPVVEWVERLGDLIGYVHLHDNNGERDEHLTLGAGTVPMEEVCQALLEYSPGAVWALEVEVPFLEQSHRWLQEHCLLGEANPA